MALEAYALNLLLSSVGRELPPAVRRTLWVVLTGLLAIIALPLLFRR